VGCPTVAQWLHNIQQREEGNRYFIESTCYGNNCATTNAPCKEYAVNELMSTLRTKHRKYRNIHMADRYSANWNYAQT
jgi:hypothetical protein